MERHLLKKLKTKCEQFDNLKVTMAFDYNRSKRKEHGESPMEILEEFKSGLDEKLINIGFYKNSNRTGVLGEILGVHHQKIYIFDDRLIIGGANLSKNYFLNRKDRYLMIRNHS
jgi:CDP-diacylglycerol--glycerol-3-phosphate 3-phosphatidyltransferase